MPTYEFRCPRGHEFEKFYRSISGAPQELPCPTCGSIAERQLSAGGGLVFKGSGFYITDYGKDGKKPQAPPAGEGSSGGGDSASGTGSGPGAKPAGEQKKGTESKPPASAPEPKKSSDKSPGKAKTGE